MKCHNTKCNRVCDKYDMAACIDRTTEEQEALKSVLREENGWVIVTIIDEYKKRRTALINTYKGIIKDGELLRIAYIRG